MPTLLPEVFVAALAAYGVILLGLMLWKARSGEAVVEVTPAEELRGARALVQEILRVRRRARP